MTKDLPRKAIDYQGPTKKRVEMTDKERASLVPCCECGGIDLVLLNEPTLDEEGLWQIKCECGNATTPNCHRDTCIEAWISTHGGRVPR